MDHRVPPAPTTTSGDANARLLATLGHELRTPLHAILGYAQLLELGVGDPADHVRRLRRAGEHLAALLDGLVDLGCLDSGTLAVRDERIDLAAVVADAFDLLAPAAAAATVTLSCDVRVGMVRADEVRLRQVLTNLVSNAVKYNRAGGTVQVRARPCGDRVALEVTDTGRGITAEHLDRLFVPFDRLGAAGGDVPGTGLGLPLSRALVEAMGGQLTVTSVPGVGTNVRVELLG